jgi:hypothetical protein
MSEKTFQQDLEISEHQINLLRSGESAPEIVQINKEQSTEKQPIINAAEVRHDVAELSEQNDTKGALEQLQMASEEPEATSPSIVSQQLKTVTRLRELKNIQSQLPVSQRTLSKVIHQPVISTLSEAGSKTVTRPSGLLGGGLVAFLGSGSYFVLAKYIGFTYNYSVSLALFAGGFTIGLLIELLVHYTAGSRRQTD